MRRVHSLSLGASAFLLASLAGAATPRAQDDALGDAALEHLRRGAEFYRKGDYARAEIEFERVARLEPDWAPLRYNRGAVAEAQGKLGLAIAEYRAFLPSAAPEQQHALSLRLEELEARRVAALARQRRIMANHWALMATAGVLTAAGVTIVAVAAARDDTTTSTQSTQALAWGVVIGAAGVALFTIGAPRLARDRKVMQQLREVSLVPTGDRDGAGAMLVGRF